ncbi:hypothetical protein AT15_08735 [Kosmotoga arenicorallina S304]|uniref:Lipoyl-binding domain-containing protein n=1 Tax=Kosmotoga arenicorallina S304 TaxID=1453497 RepID=A0A176K206_9BACT|nr:biotin/lipoyl-containing protein [Kosmotoga arenicorallina]OAA31050.1 hypothetical protein AT15_08735 [Kosmotoga arenicorallina S304]
MLKKYRVRVNGKEYLVEVEEIQNLQEVPASEEQGSTSGVQRTAPVRKVSSESIAEKTAQHKSPEHSTGGSLISPMTGIILDVLVSAGDYVNKGDKVIVMEAMKMENSVLSDRDGVIKEVRVKKGDNINAGDIMIVFE